MEGAQLFFLFPLRRLFPLLEQLNAFNIADTLETNFSQFAGFFDRARARGVCVICFLL
jgi:hypothetical protein